MAPMPLASHGNTPTLPGKVLPQKLASRIFLFFVWHCLFDGMNWKQKQKQDKEEKEE